MVTSRCFTVSSFTLPEADHLINLGSLTPWAPFLFPDAWAKLPTH